MKKNFLKGLFCDHIYKDIEREYITTKKVFGALFIYEFDHFAVKIKCLKCGKEKYRIFKTPTHYI